jgi:hypothetical protein
MNCSCRDRPGICTLHYKLMIRFTVLKLCMPYKQYLAILETICRDEMVLLLQHNFPLTLALIAGYASVGSVQGLSSLAPFMF